MKETTFICTYCGEEHPISERFEFGDDELCQHCRAEETVICSCCENRIWSENNAGSIDTPLCQSCYDRYDYTNCIRCGTLLRQENARYARDDEDHEEALCARCYFHTAQTRTIQDYFYKPQPIFYGEGDRFFGVELEIDEGGESDSSACTILKTANGNGLEHLYCKHDGSLEDGFELVTPSPDAGLPSSGNAVGRDSA